MHGKTRWVFELCSGYPNFRESGFVSLSNRFFSFEYISYPCLQTSEDTLISFCCKNLPERKLASESICANHSERKQANVSSCTNQPERKLANVSSCANHLERKLAIHLYKCNCLCLPEEQFNNFTHYLADSCTSRIYMT